MFLSGVNNDIIIKKKKTEKLGEKVEVDIGSLLKAITSHFFVMHDRATDVKLKSYKNK